MFMGHRGQDEGNANPTVATWPNQRVVTADGTSRPARTWSLNGVFRIVNVCSPTGLFHIVNPRQPWTRSNICEYSSEQVSNMRPFSTVQEIEPQILGKRRRQKGPE